MLNHFCHAFFSELEATPEVSKLKELMRTAVTKCNVVIGAWMTDVVLLALGDRSVM